MTIVTDTRTVNTTGGTVPAFGYVYWWLRPDVPGESYGDSSAIAVPFDAAGSYTVEINPSGPDDYWTLITRVPGLPDETYHFQVPAVTLVTVSELVAGFQVDPITLSPLIPVPPSIQNIVDEMIVDSRLDEDDLVLIQNDLGEINVGSVRGPTGPEGQTGPTGQMGPVGPEFMVWRGAWNESTDYSENDAVSYLGSSYFATAEPGVNDIPTDGSPWEPFAIQGSQGDPGPAGPEGAQGPLGEDGAPGPKGDPGDPASNLITSVNGHTGVVVLGYGDVGAASAAQGLLAAQALPNPLLSGGRLLINGDATPSTASWNTLVGSEAGLGLNASATSNTLIGERAGRSIVSGPFNSIVGSSSAVTALATTTRATSLGALVSLTTDATAIGAGAIATHAGAVAIGRASGGTIATNAATSIAVNDFVLGVTEHTVRIPGTLRFHNSSNEQTTVGSAGAASAPPATPTKYIKIIDSTGTALLIPAYAVS